VTESASPAASVVEDQAEAARLVRDGERVVLILDPAAGPLGEWPEGPGRLALLVGTPGDPEVRAAAAEMAAELWGQPASSKPSGQNSTITR
jgi:hypothetical protein